MQTNYSYYYENQSLRSEIVALKKEKKDLKEKNENLRKKLERRASAIAQSGSLNEYNMEQKIVSLKKENAQKMGIIDKQLDESKEKIAIINSLRKENSKLNEIIRHKEQEDALLKAKVAQSKKTRLVDEKSKLRMSLKIDALEGENSCLVRENSNLKSMIGMPEKNTEEYTRYLEKKVPVGTIVQFLSSDLKSVTIEEGEISKVCKKTVNFTYVDAAGSTKMKNKVPLERLRVVSGARTE